ILAGANPKMREDPPQHLLVEFDGGGLGRALLDGDEIGKAMTEFCRRQYEISNSHRDRAARHRGIFSLVRILHQDDTARLLHRPQTDGAVGASSAQDDGKSVAEPLGERAEEHVDWRSLATRLVEFHGRDPVIDKLEAAIGGDNIDMIGLKLLVVFNLHDWHPR